MSQHRQRWPPITPIAQQRKKRFDVRRTFFFFAVNASSTDSCSSSSNPSISSSINSMACSLRCRAAIWPAVRSPEACFAKIRWHSFCMFPIFHWRLLKQQDMDMTVMGCEYGTPQKTRRNWMMLTIMAPWGRLSIRFNIKPRQWAECMFFFSE